MESKKLKVVYEDIEPSFEIIAEIIKGKDLEGVITNE